MFLAQPSTLPSSNQTSEANEDCRVKDQRPPNYAICESLLPNVQFAAKTELEVGRIPKYANPDPRLYRNRYGSFFINKSPIPHADHSVKEVFDILGVSVSGGQNPKI